MANETEKSTLKLDLDTVEFIKKALEAQGSIQGIGNSENLKGLIEGLGKATMVLGVVGAAFLALKETMDLVFEAEKIEKINNQFDILSKNAGIAGETLKEGLLKAVDGLVDDTDVLQAANKALVEMGSNAARLPEIMELARKSTAVMGGDLIQNFENMSMALATGRTRMLAHMGIVVDSDKALRDYAHSIGKFKDDLTEAEKKQALFNAAMDKGHTALKDIKPPAESLTETWTKMIVSLKNLGELAAITFNKLAGPTIRAMFSSLKDSLDGVSSSLRMKFGDEAERAAAKVENLRLKIKATDENIEKLQDKDSFINKLMPDEVINKKIESLKQIRLQQQELYNEAKNAASEMSKGHGDAGPAAVGGTDNSSKLSAQNKFNEDLLKLKEQNITAEIAMDDDYEKIKEDRLAQEEIREEQFHQRMISISQYAKEQGIQGSEQEKEMKIEALKAYEEESKRINQEKIDDDRRVADNAVRNADTAASAFTKGWQKAGKDSGGALVQFSKLGQAAHQGMTSAIVAGAKAMADGSENAAVAMRKVFFGYLGEKAMYAGAEMILESIWPPNPLGLAAGAGLLALGAELSSMSGGGSSAPSVGGIGGGGSSSISSPEPPPITPVQQDQQGPQKHVTIAIQGHYFNTSETQRTLMDMIRQETDSTGYTYVQINPGTG